MAIDINLAVENSNSGAYQERVKKLTRISFAALFIVAFFSFLIFLLGLRFSANSVRKQQEKTLTNIAAYNQTSAKLFLLTNRIGDISYLVKNRKDSNKILADILAIIPTSVKVESFILKGDKIEIKLKSNSLFDINEFLNKLLLYSSTDKKITNVMLESLGSNQNGFDVVLNLQIL
jgi:hypothetical protein